MRKLILAGLGILLGYFIFKSLSFNSAPGFPSEMIQYDEALYDRDFVRRMQVISDPGLIHPEDLSIDS